MTDQLIEAIEKSIFVDGIPQWDDFLGLYFGEYRRRSQGVDAVLYKNQPEKFREKFGENMDSKVEHDREGYLRRLLIDIVQNRKKIPVIIVDNTDEFDLELRAACKILIDSERRKNTQTSNDVRARQLVRF